MTKSISELVESASFIFRGTILEKGKSSVPHVPPHPTLITARLDRSFRASPVLGELRGKIITVRVAAPESFSPGQEFIFLAKSWVRGRGIAVRALTHVGIEQEAAVADAVADLPNKHLRDRIQSADAVVVGTIGRIDPPQDTLDQHAALWAAAHLGVNRTLRGPHSSQLILYFPTADWPPWVYMPRYAQGQRGVFILQSATPDKARGDQTLPPGGFIALDPADFQDESRIPQLEQLIGEIR